MRRAVSALAAAGALGFWLGPWSSSRPVRGVARRSIGSGAAGETRAYVYEPATRPRGVYLVLPGLHFLGPDDPRLDRFCRILAKGGFIVVAPFIGAFCRMVLDPSAFDDAERALAVARQLASENGLPDPALFSISFGSILALHLAARPRPPAGACLFGGYADFLPTVRFAVTGESTFEGEQLHVERDPLNAPVVYLNLLRALAVEGDRGALARAWLTMVYRTWGKMELKAKGARDPFAHAIAAELAPSLRAPFLWGCGLAAPGDDPDGARARAWLDDGLSKSGGAPAWLDPRELIPRAACPIVCVHGRDDDVIPYFESMKIFRALPKEHARGLRLTGLYGHTGAAEGSAGAREQAREAMTLVRMLLDLARAPLG